MSALSIQPTFPIFTGTDGLPLENGYIWIGTANLDPQGNLINVYWDAALTIAAAQPIRTLAGYPSRSGTPARVYVNSDYSIRVQDKNASTVYSAPQATERYGNIINADGVVYDPPFTGAVQINVEAKLAQTVSVMDFGAVGDGVTDDTAAIQLAIDDVAAGGGGRVNFPRGEYKVTSAITVASNIILSGEGKRNTKLLRTFTGDFIASFGGYAGIEYLTIDGQTATHGSGRGVVMSGATPNSFMLQAEITNFSQACLEFGADSGSIFRAMQCDFYTTGAVGTVAAIRVNGTDTAATSRHFTDCESGGCTLYDFGGTNDVYVSGGYTNGLIFGAASSKVMVANIRIGSLAGTVTIAGSGHQITNCVFASAVILTCTNSNFDCQVPDYDITDSGTGNDVFIKERSYTPTWTATGGGASVGDGSITGRWSRQGNLVAFQIALTLGSTSAVGSGTWEFTLPVADNAAAPVQMCGIGFASNAASSASTVFAVRVTPGAQKVLGLYGTSGTGAPNAIGATTPAATWGSGSTIRFSGSYYTQ